MEKLLIIAYELRHAEYYAREIAKLQRSKWVFVSNPECIWGRRRALAVLLIAPRHNPTDAQRMNRIAIEEHCRAYEIDVTRIILP